MKVTIFALIYILLFLWAIYKLDFFNLKKIEKVKLLGLFAIKILAGFIYIYLSKNYLSAGDVFSYYRDGLIVYERLLEGDWATYLQLTFGLNNVEKTANILVSIDEMGFWFDTSAYMIVRCNALINLFTFGNSVYLNAIFFSFLSFTACVLLAKVFEENLSFKSAFPFYSIFLAPSLLFWTSGMHKETLSIFLIAIILFSFFKLLAEKKISFFVLFVLSFGLLYETRFFIASMMLPPILSYFLWFYLKRFRPLFVFTSFFSFLLLATYIIPFLFGVPNLVDEVLAKKALYEALDNGNTAINLGVYEASYFGIAKKVPQALFNSLFRPHFLDVKSIFLGLASLESFLLSCSLLVSLFYIKQVDRNKRAFIYLLLGFVLSYLILTGLIVPNLGAILRYRSVALFLMIPTVAFLLEKR